MLFRSQLAEGYRERREVMCDALEKLGFGFGRPDGAYYVMCDTTRLDPEGDDVAFAERLVREAGVAAVPGSSFNTSSHLGRRKIRFAFPKRLETLHLAAERLQALA